MEAVLRLGGKGKPRKTVMDMDFSGGQKQRRGMELD